MSKALIVVDVQNDFLLNDGSLNLGHDTQKLRNDIAEFIIGFEGKIYLTRDYHQEDDCEFKTFPAHCVEDTGGCDLVSEVNDALGKKDYDDLDFIEKKSFTGKEIDRLTDEFAEAHIEEIHIVGVCLHICVHDVVATVVNRSKDTHGYIPQIIIHQKLVDDFDVDMGNFALKRMQNLYGAKIV